MLNALVHPDPPDGMMQEPVDQQRRFLESILIVLFSLYLLVDSVNGFAMIVLKLPSILSPAYKLGLLSLTLLYAFRYRRQTCIWCCICLAIILVWALLRFFLVDQTGAFHSIQESLKLLYFFVVMLVVSSFRYLTSQIVSKVLLTVMGIVLLNVVSTYLGYGERTYGVFGAKGYFYSGNILSGVLVICGSFFLVSSYNRSLLRFMMISGFFCLVSLLIGTKGGILGILLATFFIIALNLNIRSFLMILLSSATISVAVYVFFDFIASSLLFDRFLYFYKTGGMYYALFSGRDAYIENLLPVLNNADWYQWLLGFDAGSLMNARQLRVELDWFDMQLFFGLVVTLIAFWGYAITFCKLLSGPHDELTLACVVSFVLLSIISVTAGHITFNGMVTPLWGLFCGAALNRYRPVNDAETI